MSAGALVEAVRAGRYPEALAAAAALDEEALRTALVTLAFDEATVSAYAFAAWRAEVLGTAAAHGLACEVASMALAHVPGAYAAGFHHARRAAELAPDDAEVLAQLLFFRTIPDRLLGAAEAEALARRILAIDPARAEARKILSPD